jgi:hypothetical protein
MAGVTDRDETPIQLVAGDLDRASEAAGVERPTEPDVDAVIDWVGPLTGLARDGDASTAVLLPEVVGLNYLSMLDEFDDEVGWSLVDVHSFVELQQPPQFVSVLSGEFDEAAIDAAQGDREDEIWSLGGEDFEVDVEERSAARPLGGSMRTALVDDRLVVARSTAPVRAAADGADDTLADDESLTAVAEALDARDVFGALLVSVDPGRGGGDGLAPFDTLGVGSAADDDGPLVVIAYAHGDEDAATTNEEQLRTLFTDGASAVTNRSWSDLLVLEDVSRDGSTVTVTLRLADDTNPMLPYQAVFQRDSFTVPG